MKGASNVRRREERECYVCQIRWCSLDHRWANRKTCSQECRHELSALTQMNPMAPNSEHKHRRLGGYITLTAIAKATGVPYLTARGILGGQARGRINQQKLRAIARKAGRASMAKVPPEVRRMRGRRAAAFLNNKRWGTPIPEDLL